MFSHSCPASFRLIMRKIFWGILLFFFCNAHLFAQSGWFKIHDLGLHVEKPLTMIENNDNIYILIRGEGDAVPYTRNAVLKLSKHGEIIWLRFFEYPIFTLANFKVHLPKALLVSKDNSIYALSYADNEDLIREFLLNKFNENGDLIWAKSYGFDGIDVEGQAFGLTLSTDSLGVIMTGRTLAPYPNQQYAIVKIDSAGNVQWKKLLPVPANSVGEQVPAVQMPDGSIKLAFDNNLLTNYQDYLMSLDSTGSIEYTFSNPFTGRAQDLKWHPNGNLVYLSNERNPPVGAWGGLRIQMLTPEFDTVWSHLFYDTEFPYLFLETALVRNLSIAPDGKILALGYNTKNCVLLCYDPNGLLLWKREIALEGFDALKFNYTIWASDGGILLNGYIYGGTDAPGDPYYEKIFLIKLDGVGCLTPGCDQTIITGLEEAGNKLPGFTIAPNPTSGKFKIEPSEKLLQEDTTYIIRIFDANGTLIYQENQPSPDMNFDLLGQRAGVYHISITNKNGGYSFDKLIKI